MAIESPSYTVEVSEKTFEVREYAPTIVATVHVSGDRGSGVSAGFRILADYIFGNNEAQTKIAMTAPVTQSQGTKISMTAPVQQQTAMKGGSDIYFTMPASYTLGTLPKPRDARINLIQTAATRMAVVTFSGFWSDSNFRTHQEQLLEFLKEHQLTAAGVVFLSCWHISPFMAAQRSFDRSE